MQLASLGWRSEFHTFRVHSHSWIIPRPQSLERRSSTHTRADVGTDTIHSSPFDTLVGQFEDTRTFGPANSFVFTIGGSPVGDAAIARDPLAGNGIERALSDEILGGTRDALPARAERLLAMHAEYLTARAAMYALERRSPDADFWRAWARARQTMAIPTRTGEPKHADS